MPEDLAQIDVLFSAPRKPGEKRPAAVASRIASYLRLMAIKQRSGWTRDPAQGGLDPLHLRLFGGIAIDGSVPHEGRWPERERFVARRTLARLRRARRD